ncbi:MAG TPA: DUF4254 domain-containing protein, partial [Bacteroidales bacterium]|nr:DUF4254 domain-containing protein [Bacteroidales bacterium]
MDSSSFSARCNGIFDKVIKDYHIQDSTDSVCKDPYPAHSIDSLLYRKNWIDTVQWHLEDIIRDPAIDPSEALR